MGFIVLLDSVNLMFSNLWKIPGQYSLKWIVLFPFISFFPGTPVTYGSHFNHLSYISYIYSIFSVLFFFVCLDLDFFYYSVFLFKDSFLFPTWPAEFIIPDTVFLSLEFPFDSILLYTCWFSGKTLHLFF